MASSADTVKRKHVTAKRLLTLLVILLLLYVIVPQVRDFNSSFREMRQADLAWLALGLIATVATYAMAAGQYYFLALKPVRLGRTFAVQCASAFTNRLLPAGIGGISLNVAYLKKMKHNNIEAGVVIAVNNLLGLVGNILVVLVIAIVGVQVSFDINVPGWVDVLIAVIVVAAVLVLAAMKALRRRAWRLAVGIFHDVLRYRLRPARLVLALVAALLLTIFYAVTLYCCVRAIGWDLSFGKVFIVFIGSVVVATATPTPGGLIGAEAAITAGLTAYGLPAGDGLAVALLYRLLTYWLPLLAGFGVFETLVHKHLV